MRKKVVQSLQSRSLLLGIVRSVGILDELREEFGRGQSCPIPAHSLRQLRTLRRRVDNHPARWLVAYGQQRATHDLANQRKTDIAELQQLQKDRAEKEQELSKKRYNEVQRAIKINNNARSYKLDLDLADHGFDFSLHELHAYSLQNHNYRRLTETDLDFDLWLARFRASQKEPQAA